MGRSAYLDEGLRLFAEGRYFLAHETLEERWIEADPQERDFLQGLIHLAVGFHHLGRGNRKGAALQLGKARSRLSAYSGVRDGLDVGALRAFLGDAAERVAAGEDVEPPALG